MNDILYKQELPSQRGFDLTFYALIEDIPLTSILDDSVDDIKEIAKKIDNGYLVYFCAKISASKAGIELGNDYLGGCIYDSYEQFLKLEKDGYLRGLIDNAINEAKRMLQELCQC